MPSPHPRILVVDDNPAARYALSRSLLHAGMQVSTAGSAEEASPLAAGADAMVVDVHLPGMSGLAFCRRLRAAEQGIRKPIILVSSFFTHERDATSGIAAGADAYLERPIHGSDLAGMLRTLLSGPAGPRLAGA